MAQKCVHKGCGKVFTDPEEACVYHPGPPVFHEGQKGWDCCKPRVLTFDEFLEIPPCTTGKHSTVDDTPQPAKKEPQIEDNAPRLKPISTTSDTTTPQPAANIDPAKESLAAIAPPTKPSTPDPRLEEDSDDPDAPIPPNTTCKRRSCQKNSKEVSSKEESCTFHPGVPIFHEGSKGWTCCKRRVLEFDEFMKIEGCKTRQGHCFVGKRSKKNQGSENQEEILEDVRNDFYQGSNTLNVSFYLKKIDKERAKVEFLADGSGVDLDLPTSDGKRFTKRVETWKDIIPEKCEKKILGTKLEMVLFKKEGGLGWPVLYKGGPDTGERIQVGRALRA
ncbi:hypothetical protein PMZ80_009958 [Knufia obscura]|uniref:Cysteine and histidine-rich domain-containing protein n=2 Tax=Knufia TaxID=430999 RepID=A0AAN8EKQ6_9EURO|nr:hypothetical protein PMZ80_009958 [Knufia obscura]KAK5956050.1 hypothetical protein OHC33_002623 [Knufia fluminis]